MSSSFTKNAVLLMVSFGAIAICVVGYQYSNGKHQVHPTMKSEVVTTAKVNPEKIKEIQAMIPTLYLNEESGILAETTTDDSIEAVVKDFDNNKGSEPFDQATQETQKQLKIVQSKLTIQKKIGQVYDQGLTWTTYDHSAVPKAGTKGSEFTKIKAEIDQLPQDDWQTIATQYNTLATEQQETVENIQKNLSKLYKNGTATEEGTKEAFIELANDVDHVKDQVKRKEFVDSLNRINEQKGYGISVF